MIPPSAVIPGATLLGAFLLGLLVIALAPVLPAPQRPLSGRYRSVLTRRGSARECRRDVQFDSHGSALSASLYLPPGSSIGRVPCVVMAAGTGGTKEMGLEAYALRFQAVGLAALVFDYRHFGASAGEPRQLLSIPRQLDDYAAAIAYARGLPEIDPGRIALWGTSASGGHVVTAAARDPGIACVTAQCPALDGRASGRIATNANGIQHTLLMRLHGRRDLLRAWFGLTPHTIPLVGKPGDIALITVPGAFEAFERLAPPEFRNEVCARIVIQARRYRPVRHAAGVRCPVLLQICERDTLVPLGAAEEAAASLGTRALVIHYPVDHFGIHIGRHFEQSVGDQVSFFRRHLLGG